MKKSLIYLSMVLLLLSCNVGFALDQPVARELVASLAQLPGLADAPDKGALVDLVKAIDEVYPGNIKIEVSPMARSIDNVVNGTADFHIPRFRSPFIEQSKLPYQYVSEKLGTVNMVIYSHKDKIITRKMIDDALAKGGQFPYAIEVTASTENSYPFPAQSSRDIEQSFLKVENKRIDAVVRAQEEADLVLKQLKLNMIHRSIFQGFDDAIIISKGPKGDEMERILSDCVKKLKASGRLQELYKKIHDPYNDWQPVNMGW